jgi:hypothetical protein
MWKPRRLTTLQAFTDCYRDGFTFTFLYGEVLFQILLHRKDGSLYFRVLKNKYDDDDF